MATYWDESRLVIPFMPSLLQFATAKLSDQLYQRFDHRTLLEACNETLQETSTTAEEVSDKIRRAKEIWLYIPSHLRGTVAKAVEGFYREVLNEAWFYEYFFEFKEVEIGFHFRSDGSLDPVKTARNVVESAKLDIKKRFQVACVFCFQESIQALWAEMEECGVTESFGTRREGIVSLWVGWLLERPRVTSAQSFMQSLGTLIARSSHIFDHPRALVPRWSTLFPLLRPEDRQECLHFLQRACKDDFRFFLYTITKKEEEQFLLENGAFSFLAIHLFYPLQSLFLELAEKLWDYIDDHCFRQLLKMLLYFNDKLGDFDYSSLLEEFWNASPFHMRRKARGYPDLRARINSFFAKKKNKRKRKSVFN